MPLKYFFIENYWYFITYHTDYDIKLSSQDKQIILNKLISLSAEMDIVILNYAILNNHFHLIFRTSEKKNEKMFIQKLAGSTARAINSENGLTGNLWKKYFAWLIASEKAFNNISAYVLGNPIRHGLVSSFDELFEYPYSDFKKACLLNGREFVENKVLAVLKIKEADDEKNFYKGFAD